MQSFEIGCIYRDPRGALVLACGANAVIYADKRVLKTRKVKARDSYKRSGASVDDLCSRWRVSSDVLDAKTAELIPAGPPSDRRRPWGKGRPKVDEKEYYKLRLARILIP